MPNKYAAVISQFRTRYDDNSAFGPQLDEAHLDKIESDLGYSLPRDYREFLRDYAGVLLEPSAIFPLIKGDYSTEARLWGFSDSREERSLADVYYQVLKNCMEMSGGPGEDVYLGIHLLRDAPEPIEEMGWPEELLPIGYDMGGNTFCLALFGLRPGAIFQFGGDIYLIADSFDEFMHLLQKPD